MGFVGNLGTKLRERKRVVAAVLSITVMVVGVFLAGTWAGSSGALTGGPVKAATQRVPGAAPTRQAPDAPKPEGMCDKTMAMEKGPNPASGMPMGKMGADMSGGMSMANMPMGNMPMGKIGPNMTSGMPMPVPANTSAR
jgi:hypothetical protein